jgi:hypothetical protein
MARSEIKKKYILNSPILKFANSTILPPVIADAFKRGGANAFPDPFRT